MNKTETTDCTEKRAVISTEQTPHKKPNTLPDSKQAAGKPSIDELDNDVTRRLSEASEESLR